MCKLFLGRDTPMIERPLPKAIAGPELLAQIIIDKYVDHLPLYRQMVARRLALKTARLPVSRRSCGTL